MNNLGKHAENELNILFSLEKDNFLFEFKDEIIKICQKFEDSGQSGSLSETIEKLCLFENISPIIGDDIEWVNVHGDTYQNKRCSALFKDSKNGPAYYIDAIIKRDQNGMCWNGSFWLNEDFYKENNKDGIITSRCYVKKFPFVPKTFYIDVMNIEYGKNNNESFIISLDKLNEVRDYYYLNISDFRNEKIESIINEG
jgi:hypothetical protein